MHDHDAVRVLAARAVYFADEPDYHYRRICRWFSREFSTPLSEVEEISVEVVLQHYYEGVYEQMPEQKLQEQLRILGQTDAERQRDIAKRDWLAVDDWRFDREQAAAAKEAAKTEAAAAAKAAAALRENEAARVSLTDDLPPGFEVLQPRR